jgi:hypothetical protein
VAILSPLWRFFPDFLNFGDSLKNKIATPVLAIFLAIFDNSKNMVAIF